MVRRAHQPSAMTTKGDGLSYPVEVPAWANRQTFSLPIRVIARSHDESNRRLANAELKFQRS